MLNILFGTVYQSIYTYINEVKSQKSQYTYINEDGKSQKRAFEQVRGEKLNKEIFDNLTEEFSNFYNQLLQHLP